MTKLSCFVPLLLGLTAASRALAGDFPPPRPWEPDAFLPLTEARLATLPAAVQPAWLAYWRLSATRAQPQLAPTDPVENAGHFLDIATPIPAVHSHGLKLDANVAWYASAESRTTADQIVAWQKPAGGWAKGGDYSRAPAATDDHHDAWSNGTFDNDATLHELRFLARVIQAAGDDARVADWRNSFSRGLEYIFAAQYPNGGFPQIYPLGGEYHDAITFNDDAMVQILELLRDVAQPKPEYDFVPPPLVIRAAASLQRGIQCVMDTQLRAPDGRRTVWAQQYDPLTLLPCAARNFEPIAECSSESVGLVRFIMTIPSPSPEMVSAVDGAMAWLSQRALPGVVWDREASTGSGLVAKPGTKDLWARFYEIGSGLPIFGDRDRTIHYTVTELSRERRKGYGWYNTRGASLPAAYAAWKKKLAAQPLLWRLDRADQIGGHATTIHGQPTASSADGLTFNGRSDGVFLANNPIEGLAEFTIEINFRPDSDGPTEQRFFHIEDKDKSRLLFETRILPGGRWALDTFLYTNETHKHALLDPTKTHACDQWTWVSLTYQNGRMTHTINGVPELTGEVDFAPMVAGTASIGVRQNLVSWFKGNIREIRFHRTALSVEALQHD